MVEVNPSVDKVIGSVPMMALRLAQWFTLNMLTLVKNPRLLSFY